MEVVNAEEVRLLDEARNGTKNLNALDLDMKRQTIHPFVK